MALKNKNRDINIVAEGGAFTAFFKKLTHDASQYDFEGLSALRKVLSNEKARILHTIKVKKPSSIYTLAKSLGRNFKSVNDDVKLLERFGFVELISEKSGKRKRLRPLLSADSINIHIKV